MRPIIRGAIGILLPVVLLLSCVLNVQASQGGLSSTDYATRNALFLWCKEHAGDRVCHPEQRP